MRIVVFSDSHGSCYRLDTIVHTQPDAGLFLHLGDGESDFEDLICLYPEKKTAFVRGNCDWGSDSAPEQLLVCAGKRIFITHGHTYGVKSGTGRLLERAGQLKADICCFGHTHVPLSVYRNGVYLLNPGSVTSPRLKGPTYGVIDITDAGIAVNIVNM